MVRRFSQSSAVPGGKLGVLAAVGAIFLILGSTFAVYGASPVTLASPNSQVDGWFGGSVAVSGSTVVVGAPYETVSGNTYAGRAYLFNANTGALVATLTSPNSQVSGNFGWSVAVSGSTVVVGAPYETAGGNPEAGRVYVYNTKTDTLVTTLTSPNSQVGGNFGCSVAVSGSTVVVGAFYETVGGDAEAGRVYLFNAKTDALVATLTSPNSQAYGVFGYSVAMTGSTVVVGANDETVGGNIDAGHAYLFNAKTDTLIATLTSPNSQAFGWFSYSVAMTGSTVVVSAVGETAGGNAVAGRAYLFNAKTGALVTTLTSPNSQAAGIFGNSVAVSGSTVVVGASYETVGSNAYAGNAYVFNEKTGALIATFTSPNSQAYGWFGTSVAMTGSTVVVGASWETVGGNANAGRVYVYNTKTDTLIATLTSPNSQAGGDFGYSVAVSGSTVVVGAPWETVGGKAAAGHAYVFNAGTGALITTLTSPNSQPSGEFGYSVAISGSNVVVGASYETVGSNAYAGHAYVFNAKTGALIATLTSPNSQANGWFGYSVAVSDSTVVVSAYGETVSGNANAGRVYVFKAKTGALLQTLTSPNSQVSGVFGWSVAMTGSTVVVGAPGETVGGNAYAGRAYVFNEKTDTLIATFTSPNSQVDGEFGWSVAIGGSTVVVGASYETVGSSAWAGRAYVFNAKTGALIATLTSPNSQADGVFGISVAVSGSTVFVGAPYETVGVNAYAGRMYTFN